jgi:hypothetical protein
VTPTPPVNLVTSNQVIDTVLARYSEPLGENARAYRNHVYRGLNYQLRMLGAATSNLLALAWATHDLGLFTARTVDYLPPSVLLAEELAEEFNVGDLDQLRVMIEFHHGVRHLSGPAAESFRMADRTDVSMGLWRGSLLHSDIDDATRSFPYCGFHRFLVKTLVPYAIYHPLRPFPMLRW